MKQSWKGIENDPPRYYRSLIPNYLTCKAYDPDNEYGVFAPAKRRIARNMQKLLKDEYFIKQVNNGEVSGSLLHEITCVTFEELQKIDEDIFGKI